MPTLDNTYLENLVDGYKLHSAIVDHYNLDPDVHDYSGLYEQSERFMLAIGKQMRNEMEGLPRDRGVERTAANALKKMENIVSDATGKRAGNGVGKRAQIASNDLRSELSAAFERISNARDSGYLG